LVPLLYGTAGPRSVVLKARVNGGTALMYVKREGRPMKGVSRITSSAQCRYHSGIAVRSALKLESVKGMEGRRRVKLEYGTGRDHRGYS
jgi:hypothetical protein